MGRGWIEGLSESGNGLKSLEEIDIAASCTLAARPTSIQLVKVLFSGAVLVLCMFTA
mgnify:CR=1 FL=1